MIGNANSSVDANASYLKKEQKEVTLVMDVSEGVTKQWKEAILQNAGLKQLISKLYNSTLFVS